MSEAALKKYASFSARDSGPPSGRRDYTTLIIFHGMGWHAAIFKRLFPLADSRDVRIVAANRPGYPGAAPFSAEEQVHLNKIAELADTDAQSATDAHLEYIQEDTKKTHDFLVDFISKEDIPLNGGIILAGWSLGAVNILGLLAYAGAIPAKESAVDLRPYIKHLVLYDAPSFLLGYAPPPNVVNPFFDTSLTTGEALKIFPRWLSSYFPHGEEPSELEYKALDYPPPTILSMDPVDVQRCLEANLALPGGFDERFMSLGVQLGAFSLLKERAIFPEQGDSQAGREWDSVETKYVWCDHTVWEVPWGVCHLQAELNAGKIAGRVTRKIDTVRVRGGNHFCHWDKPDLALAGLLSGL